jgi:hypothetical protein
MSKLFLLMMMVVALAWLSGGCATKSGSREFVPGQGWQQN